MSLTDTIADTTMTDTMFEKTAPGAEGQLPGEDPFKLHAHLRASLEKAASSASFLKVKSTGQFMTINDRGWAMLTPDARTQYVMVPYYADHYVVVASKSYQGYYLSFNNQSYIGVYSSWSNAAYWAVDPLDCSKWPGLYPFQRTIIDPTYVCVNGIKDEKFGDLIEIISA